jgi:hypothetical protein
MRNFTVWAAEGEIPGTAGGTHVEVVNPSVGCGIGVFMQHNSAMLQMN